jgi:hypothetical protein
VSLASQLGGAIDGLLDCAARKATALDPAVPAPLYVTSKLSSSSRSVGAA